MCGIGGKLYFDPARPVEREVLERMSAVQAHRGPDDAGIYCQGPVGLAHRRLSIIDLSRAGHQPMCNEDRTVWIVFNGEIYNFRELRRFLDSLGHEPKYRWHSQTDTEVVLHLYEEFGTDCLPHLHGMFAFAIWDVPRRQLFLARDRLGVKPLTYQQDPNAFRFASEAKGILADPDVQREPDLEAISHYLTFGYVPSPMSAFLGFRQLPPGSAMIVQDGRVKVWRWWEPTRKEKLEVPREERCEAIRNLFREAVASRLVADVPVGVFLSGGVDSSAVVAFMYGLGVPVETFSMGFAEEDFDERGYARIVADRFGTVHHELQAVPQSEAILPYLAWHYDEPFGDSSAIATYLLAEATSEIVKVVLTGDGGDEAFGGYRRYVAQRAAMRLPDADQANTYARWFCMYHRDRWTDITTPEFDIATRGDGLQLLQRLFADSTGADPTDAAMDVDTRLYLPDDLLVKMDRATMGNGLEARSPFLDHRLVEYATRIPSGEKVGWGQTKRILKHALRGILPDAILHRPKMGFGVPLAAWLRGPLRAVTADLLSSRRVTERGWFHPEKVCRMLAEHQAGSADHATPIWYLLMLELWHQRHIEARA